MIYYILITYFIGNVMMQVSYNVEKQLKVIDIIMLVLSPFTIPTMIIIKLMSHLVDLESIVMKE